MRVLFLTHRLPYAPNRGDRNRAYHIVRQLGRRAEVDLFSLTHDAEEESHSSDVRRVVSRLATARVPRARNLARAMLALPTSRPLTHILLDAPGIASTLHHMVAERPPDVVLAYCSSMARFALEAPLRSTPAVVDMVDVDSVKWGDLARVTPPPRRWIYRRERRHLARFERDAARHAYATLVVNERERATLLRVAPGAKVCVVPIGVELDTFQPPSDPASSSTVVFCGVMNYSPNEQAAVWLAETIWPLVRRERPEARLQIVGANPTPRLRALAGYDPSIEVTGTVPDVRPYLWGAAVATAPLTTARGIQTKVLEAIAAGLPSVVTPLVLDGLPPEITPACRVAETADAFAAAILALLERTPGERRALAGRANLAALGWSERLGPLFEILERAASATAGI